VQKPAGGVADTLLVGWVNGLNVGRGGVVIAKFLLVLPYPAISMTVELGQLAP